MGNLSGSSPHVGFAYLVESKCLVPHPQKSLSGIQGMGTDLGLVMGDITHYIGYLQRGKESNTNSDYIKLFSNGKRYIVILSHHCQKK